MKNAVIGINVENKASNTSGGEAGGEDCHGGELRMVGSCWEGRDVLRGQRGVGRMGKC